MSVQISLCVFALNSFSVYWEVELLNHVVILLFSFWGLTILIPILAVPFSIPTNSVQVVLISLHLHQHLFFSGFCFCSYGSHPIGLKRNSFFISGINPVFYPNINSMVARLSLLTLVYNCPSGAVGFLVKPFRSCPGWRVVKDACTLSPLFLQPVKTATQTRDDS